MGQVLAWGDGDAIKGTPFRELIPTAATEGRLCVLSAEMPPGLVVDEHVHENEDQITVVIEGCVGVRLGSETFVARPGAAVFMPRGVPHSQWCEGGGPARVLEIYTPGGFEDVFRAAGSRAAGHGGEANADDYAAARS